MSRRPGRGLTEQDRAVWAGYAAQVRVLKGRSAAEVLPVVAGMGAPVAAVVPVPVAPRKAVSRPGMLVIGHAPAGVDRATWQRFRGGKLPIGRRLDLHGHTAQRAFDRFEQTLQAAAAHGVRCIEVITGRGAGEHGGVLRREFPLWLNLPHVRPLILAASHPHAGNDGAVLLLLRRAREPGAGLAG